MYPVISGPDDYSFQFKHWDNDGMCLDISGRIYFDAPGAQGVSAERTVVGTLTAMSFVRHRGGGFFGNADVRQDSMDMALACFDDFGRAKGALATVIKPEARANRGTLLYLTEVIVDEAHRGNDLGLHFASAACLDFFEEWSLAMTEPYPKDFWRNLDRARQRDILDRSPRPPADVAECQRVGQSGPAFCAPRLSASSDSRQGQTILVLGEDPPQQDVEPRREQGRTSLPARAPRCAQACASDPDPCRRRAA